MTSPRVVFDAVVFVQALISGRGPAAACLDRVFIGQAVLFMSDAIFAEVRDVPLRPELTSRYSHLTSERIDAFVRQVQAAGVHIPVPPKAFVLPRDPRDEPYTDLAIAAQAAYLVTWNQRHLTYLMRRDTPEGREFCQRFPDLVILSPPDFLHALSGGGGNV